MKYLLNILFIFFVIISYRSAKPRYKPENFTDIFNDFSWLQNWPKWLDFPLMQPLNSGFDWLIVNYGLFFEGINNLIVKDKLKELTSNAFEKELFGAPTFVVNNKIFWGQDRLEYAIE